MYIKHILGEYGENLACSYLEKQHYKIIQRNFRCKYGEIDIIVKDLDSNELVFVEVKTRSSFLYGRPSQAVNKTKQNHIIKVAKYYTLKNKIKNSFLRFDVIEIFVENNTFNINHIKQII